MAAIITAVAAVLLLNLYRNAPLGHERLFWFIHLLGTLLGTFSVP